MFSFREYFENSSLHGLKYFCQEGRHWSERLFWLVCCSVSIWGAGVVVMATWNNFQTEAISFVSDTNYLNWNTSFPSMTVCEMENDQEKTENYLISIGLVPDDSSDLVHMFHEIAFFTGLCNECSKNSPYTWPDENQFYNISLALITPCDTLFHSCKWNGEPFRCCDRFKLIRTEMGVCFSINSLQTIEKPNINDFLIVNDEVGAGKLELAFTSSVKIHHHGSQDVPTWTSAGDIDNTQLLEVSDDSERIVTVTETINELEVRDLSEAQRRCRFLDETKEDSLFRVHSFTACETDCRMKLIELLCNCTLHFLPTKPGVKVCDPAGLSCISRNQEWIKVLRTSVDKSKNTFHCSCLPSCTDPEQNLVFSYSPELKNRLNWSEVRVSLSSLPTERLKRIVVRGKLDLVVAAGGIVGLFMGASLLSTVELVYFLLIRPVCNRLMEKKKE